MAYQRAPRISCPGMAPVGSPSSMWIGNPFERSPGAARPADTDGFEPEDSTEDPLVNTDRLDLVKVHFQGAAGNPAFLDDDPLVRDGYLCGAVLHQLGVRLLRAARGAVRPPTPVGFATG